MTRPDLLELVHPAGVAGARRKVGIEIELGDLDEGRVAEIAARLLGGRVKAGDDHRTRLEGSALGDLEIYLDSAYRAAIEDDLPAPLRALAEDVIPVEIVTPPIDPADIAKLDRLCAALREAGAVGTTDGVLLGFGVHLNVETTGAEVADLLPVLTAFALVEDVLREDGMDRSRKVLPFTRPYPRDMVRALCSAAFADTGALMQFYLAHAPSRNHGLDMLPILAEIDPDRVADAVQDDAVSARPAWHYRMPDSRIGDPDWSVGAEWNRWVRIERIAARPDLLERLRRAWLDHDAGAFASRAGWAKTCREVLGQDTP
jgi:hypothetical protein